jgi:BirA family transcriptional regulator, biotin operon repressor / biotin---[acetyl-CoA-carboxylase] ligase
MTTFASLNVANLRARLSGRNAGRRIEVRRTVDSTSKLACALAREGAPEGTVVLAEEQTRGRGRGDHTWFSPPGLGLYLSLVLRPPEKWMHMPVFGVLGGVAAARAVRESTGLDARLKWPNDVLIQDRKAGGILAEVFSSQAGREPILVLGIGLNVHHGPEELPPHTPIQPTSLAIEGWTEPDRTRLAASVVLQVEDLYVAMKPHGIASLERAFHAVWAERDWWVELDGPPPLIEGRARTLDLEGGCLVLEDHEGKALPVPLNRFLRLKRLFPPGNPASGTPE